MKTIVCLKYYVNGCSYANKIAEQSIIDIIKRNRALVKPFSEIIDEALLHYNQPVFSNAKDLRQLEIDDIESSCQNKSDVQQSTQDDISMTYLKAKMK